MHVILSKALGIDLGTTNSAVGLMNPSDTDVLLHRDEQHRETTPSCVWRDPGGGRIVVGHKAFARCGTVPAPVRSFKTLMGQDVKIDLGGGCKMSPEELSAEVLKEMKRQIEEDARRLSTPESTWQVNRAIVTVPAYFGQPQVGATMRAAELAGLELLELLHEPTAAATYHCWRTGTKDGAFMVFDLGGGTFDVTILKVTAGAFSVLGLSGHTQLGGDNLDTAIAEGMLQRLKSEGYMLDLNLKEPEDRLRFDLLKFLAEGVKKRLSDAQEYVLRDGTTLQDKNGRAVIFNTLFERKDVVAWMQPVIERTISYCWEALEQAKERAGLKLEDIDQIILAGGSTHIPAVQERVRREFCSLSPEEWAEYRAESGREGRSISPQAGRARCQKPVYDKVDTIVALGAAIRAAAVGGLHLTDSERTMRVEARGVAATDRTVMQVDGHVKALAGASLADTSICLYVPEPHFDQTVTLREDGHFVFRDVPMTSQGEAVLNFEILDGEGQPLAVMARTMRGGNKSVIPGGTTVVLPKAISMDVMRDTVKERMDLIPAGASLPAKANFILRHPGGTNQIRFVLYQRSRLIKEVVVPVDSSLPKGTQIDLTINVDEFSFITMQGKIGEKPFDAAIEPPPPRELPTLADVEALTRSFDEGKAYLDTGPKMAKEARFKQAMRAYEGALARDDKHQALHEFEELEDVVAGVARATVVLQPPKIVFDKRVTEMHELIQWGRGILQAENQDTAPVRDWVARVETQREVGEKAYQETRESDQAHLADALQQLMNLRDYIRSVLRPFVINKVPSASIQERVHWKLEKCAEDLEDVRAGAQAAMRQKELGELRKLEQELGVVGDLANHDPEAASGRLETIHKQLQKMARELSIREPGGWPEV